MEKPACGRVTDYISSYYHIRHCDCAETVFRSAMDAWGLSVPTDFRKLLEDYGGGPGGGIICGAVAGGCAALSCRSDQWSADRKRKDKRKAIRAFIRLVREHNASGNCLTFRPKYAIEGESCFQTIWRVSEVLDEVCEME